MVDQRSGLRDVAGLVPPPPTVMYLVRVMLLGILSVRTIKRAYRNASCKTVFLSFWGKRMVREKKIWSYVFDERERVPSKLAPLVAREKTRTEFR